MGSWLMLRYKGDIPGHPVFLDRTFDKASGGDNRRESPFRVYFTSYTQPPVVFLCKHSMLDFDYYELGAGEYLFSDRLSDAARACGLEDLPRIDALLLSTKRKPLSERSYAVVRLREAINAVDPQASSFTPAASDPQQMVCHRLVFDRVAVQGHDLFRIKEGIFAPHLFCSDRFKSQAEERGARLRFVPEAEAARACLEYDALAPR